MPARFLTSLLLCLPALSSFGQELPRVLNFTRSVYAAQSQNWAVTQAEDGTMFFANNGGLLEYDGAKWRSYGLPEGQIIRTVAWRRGRVYAGGFAEFGYFEYDSKLKWRYQSLSASLPNDRALREEMWNILVHPVNGHIYFQSFSTIYKYDGQKTTELIPPANIMFLHKVGQRVFFPGIGRGLFELLPEDGFRFYEGSELLANSTVSFLVPVNKAEFLAGTNSEGLFLCNDSGCRPWTNPLNSIIRSLQPNKALVLPGGKIAVGTVLGGVFIIDADGALLHHFDMETGLQNNTVLAMLCDRAGNLWLGLDKGIDLVELNSPLVWFVDHSGKIGTTYTAALFKGHLYLGTNQGVFYKPWDDGKMQPGSITQNASNFSLVPGTQGQVWQLEVFDGQLLCGHNEGTFLIENGTALKISDVTGGWLTLPVPGKDDKLVQATYTGLIVLEKKNSGKWLFSHRVKGLSDPFKKIAFDETGALWLVHPNRGLWRVSLNDDCNEIRELKRYGPEDGLKSDFRLNLIQAAGNLLVKSDSLVLRIQAGRLVPFSIPDAQITEFDFEEDGKILVFPQKCIFVQSNYRQEFSLTLFPDYEKIIRIRKSEFLFCLENGYALWRKESDRPVKTEIQNELRINAVEILTDTPQWYFPNSNEPVLRIPSFQNNLRFYASQPFFTHPSELAWELSGPVNRSWDNSQHYSELTSLPPGNYKLRVADQEGSNEDTFLFEILKPWWQTWWATAIWMALAGVLLLLIERYNKIRLNKQKARLDKEKLRELEEQKVIAERERLKVVLANKNRELSNATINLIRKNETLIELKGEFENLKVERKDKGRLDRIIDNHISADQDWSMFEEAFNQVHDEFFKKLKGQFPNLTPGDLRLAAFLKLNLSSKEISSLLGMSVRGVENKRYRLRKKIGLDESDNLTGYMMEI